MRERFYRCQECGWRSSAFGDHKTIGDTTKAVKETLDHFKSEHAQITEEENPTWKHIGEYVEVVHE